MSRAAPAWHAEAREMHERGVPSLNIALALKQRKCTVDRVLREDGRTARREREERLAHLRREEAARAAAKERAARRPDTMAIARRYVAGEIDRHEMMRMLRVEARS